MPFPYKSLYSNNLYDLIIGFPFLKYTLICTGFAVKTSVHSVSFCTISFQQYIVQNFIPIIAVHQVVNLLFNITLQYHLFSVYVQMSYKNKPQSTVSIAKIRQRISHRNPLSITNYPLFSRRCTIKAVQIARLLFTQVCSIANLYIICTFSLRCERA